MFVLYELKEDLIETECYSEMLCLKFCCKNSSFCKETIIRESMNQSMSHRFDAEFVELKALYGKPTCSSLSALTVDEDWTIGWVS